MEFYIQTLLLFQVKIFRPDIRFSYYSDLTINSLFLYKLSNYS